MIDLKKLLTRHGIHWIDQGPNCGKNHINIKCPLCGNADKSHHLAINERSGQYYCFRNPRHAGNYCSYIFRVLRIPTDEYKELIFTDSKREYTPDDRDYSAMRYFVPAEQNKKAVQYLESRLFSDPIAAAQKFGLMISEQGIWAGRLIVPLTIGWTGRAMLDGLEPRYKAWTSNDGFFLYRQQADNTSVIIVEGSLDAMRVASVTTQFDVIAKCRMAISDAIFAYIRDIGYWSVYVAPDTTVPLRQRRIELRAIASYLPNASAKGIETGKKDFGATPEDDTRKILSCITN